MISVAKIALSFFIVAVVGAQILFAFKPPHRFRYWPFLSYPMYNMPHYAGDTVPVYRLTGILEDGRAVPIGAADLNLKFFQFLHGPVRAILRGDKQALRPYVDDWNRRRGENIATVRLENHAVGLAEDGTFLAPVETHDMDVREGTR